MKYIGKMFVVLVCCATWATLPLYSQLPDPGCPPASEECDGPLIDVYHWMITINPRCTLEVNYSYRVCSDGSFQFYIRDILAVNNCEGMTSLEVDGLSLSTLIEYVQLNIMQRNLEDASDPWDAPNCETDPGQTSTIVQFYSANCWVWQKCTWEIEATPPVCDTDPQPDFPPPGGLSVDKWSWHDCGRTCCKRTYEVCVRSGEVQFDDVMVVKSMTREKIGDCSDQNSFQKPCQDGC